MLYIFRYWVIFTDFMLVRVQPPSNKEKSACMSSLLWLLYSFKNNYKFIYKEIKKMRVNVNENPNRVKIIANKENNIYV